MHKLFMQPCGVHQHVPPDSSTSIKEIKGVASLCTVLNARSNRVKGIQRWWLFHGTERNGTELGSKIWNGTGLTERSFPSFTGSGKGSRALDYVHNVILERKTVHYSYYIITDLQSTLKKDSNAHMQASNAGNKA